MRKIQLVVVAAMALLALVGAVLLARGGSWFLVALPVCVCAIGVAGLTTRRAAEVRRVTAVPLLLVGALGVGLGAVAVARDETPINIFMALAVLGTVLAVVGALMQVRRAAAVQD